jgi:hypothetical protein
MVASTVFYDLGRCSNWVNPGEREAPPLLCTCWIGGFMGPRYGLEMENYHYPIGPGLGTICPERSNRVQFRTLPCVIWRKLDHFLKSWLVWKNWDNEQCPKYQPLLTVKCHLLCMWCDICHISILGKKLQNKYLSRCVIMLLPSMYSKCQEEFQ